MRKNISDKSVSWMSLTAAVPIVIGLGARILFNTISKAPGSSGYLEQTSTNGDYIVQGLFQGALLQYVFSEFPSFAPALAVAFVARALLDFQAQNNTEKLTITLISAVGGAAASFLLSAAIAEGFQDSSAVSVVSEEEEEEEPPPRLSSSERRRIRREHARSRLQEVNQKREPSVPRRGASLVTDETGTSSLELTGYTGLGRLVDLQLGNLRKKAAIAEADRRRCKEERKWALSSGNKARATQLTWQIKRYAAMAESYTREADRRIIEVARMSGNGKAADMGQDAADPYAQRYNESHYGEQHYPPEQRYGAHPQMQHQQQPQHQLHQHYYPQHDPGYNPMMSVPQPPPPTFPEERRYTRVEKGKTPIRSVQQRREMAYT